MDTTRNAFISATSLAPISESEDEIIVSTTLYQNFDETRFYSLQNQSRGRTHESEVWGIVCEGILSVIVGVFGLMGNGATIAVLSRPMFKGTFHKLLICLACFDSLFIGSAMLVYSIRAYKLYLTESANWIHVIFMSMYPIMGTAMYGSIYITLAVSIERYLGVVYPMQSRTRPRRNLWAYLLPVLVLAISFNVPKFLELGPSQKISENNSTNATTLRGINEDLEYTKIKVWLKLITTAIIPITVLVFCNAKIFYEVRKSRLEMLAAKQTASPNTSQHQQQENGAGHNHHQQQQPIILNGRNGHRGSSHRPYHSSDFNLAIILAGIVIVFLLCHMLRFFLEFYAVATVERTNQCMSKGQGEAHPTWLYTVSALSHLMLIVNSSINFVIYCAVGSKFRKALVHRFTFFGDFFQGSNSREVEILACDDENASANNPGEAHGEVLELKMVSRHTRTGSSSSGI